MAGGMLPEEFSGLEPFAPKWCLAKESDRFATRLDSSMAEIQSFYDALLPRVDAALDYCDRFPLDDMPEDALNLLHLLYSLATVSFAVECWGQPRIPDSGATYLDLVSAPEP